MKAFKYAILSALIGLSIALPLSADEPIKRDGLEITVTDMKKKVGEHWKFMISVKNTTDQDKSFEGKITLLQPSAAGVENPPPNVVAECTVFKKIPAGQSIEDVSYCEGRSYTGYEFEVVKVYDFIDE